MPAIDVDDYRKEYAEAIERAEPAARPRGRARSRSRAAEDEGPMDTADVGERMHAHLATATDRRAPVAERVAALQSIAALEFLGPRFAPHQVEFVEVLRSLASDPRATVRRSALELLALRGDPDGRAMLVRGLEKPADALVPDAVALQLLGHDSHGETVPLARRIYRRSTGAAREEALRILATDPSSAKLLERLMKDKSETSSIRRLSASALQELDPDRFATVGRRLVADDDEFNEIRATTLTALAQRTPTEPAGADDAFVRTVAELHDTTRSRAMKSSTEQFLRASDAETTDP